MAGLTRDHPVVLDHLDGVLAALAALPFPVNEWRRPQDATDETYINPPYALVRVYPSAGQFSGPLDNTQVDAIFRIQLLGVGLTTRQAINVTDLCAVQMQRTIISVTNRAVMDVRRMVTHGGVAPDDDLPTPFFYSSDLYELWTTPS